METIHALKTDPQVFQESWMGVKMYEIRFDDRNYHVGDILILKETVSDGEMMKHGAPLVFTGRQLTRRIICKTKKYGMQEGWCILGLEKV